MSTEQRLETRQGGNGVQPPPYESATCTAGTAGTDKLASCWTEIWHVAVEIEVTQKNRQNPTYSQVDASGQVVDSGRFTTNDFVEMQSGWTLRIRGPARRSERRQDH